jgi:hypothetical protein
MHGETVVIANGDAFSRGITLQDVRVTLPIELCTGDVIRTRGGTGPTLRVLVPRLS